MILLLLFYDNIKPTKYTPNRIKKNVMPCQCAEIVAAKQYF